MAPPISLLVLGFFLSILFYKYIIVPVFFSPLSKIPHAHILCAVTSRWLEHQRKNQRELKTLVAAHQKHGPIVRLGPDEISVVSREGLRLVYTAGLEKSSWYSNEFYNYGTPNLVSIRDHKTHSVQKRMISGLYANSYLQHSSDLATLSRQIVYERLLPLMQNYATSAEDVNVVDLFQWAAIDFTSAFLFGTAHGTDYLRDENGRHKYFEEWKKIKEADYLDLSQKVVMEEVNMKMCQDVLKSQAHGKNEGTQPVIFSKLYTEMSLAAKSEQVQLSQKDVLARCASEMLDQIIAAHETTATTLTYVVYHLSQDPTLQENLRTELSTLQPAVKMPDATQEDVDLPPPSSIDKLPLLNAVLQETLRLHASAPCRLPRVVPEGGFTVHGYWIPGGTTISNNAYTMHRQENVFPHADEWISQRWIPQSDLSKMEKGDTNSYDILEMKRWFWAFGSGGRMCIGSNFALQMLKLIIAAIYTDFKTTIIDDEGIEQSDSYISGPVGNKLIVRFQRV